MDKLTHGDLYGLEEYARIRPEFHAKVIAHKRNRKVQLGPNMTVHFEDRLTIQYQVQEMLRTERLFNPEEIEDEIDAYNPLIPDGSNWKATIMIEYADEQERRTALASLMGIEDRIWVQVAGMDRIYAIADEDLDRETAEKTSSVHFLRFELNPEMVRAVKQGAAVGLGCDHPQYNHDLQALPVEARDSLAADLG